MTALTIEKPDPLVIVPPSEHVHRELLATQARERLLRRQLRVSLAAEQERQGLAGLPPQVTTASAR